MKRQVVAVFCLGAAYAGYAAMSAKDAEDPLQSGAIIQLEFTTDSKHLIVANEYKYFNNDRTKCHSRVRSFARADWKVIADTGELDLIDLSIAPSARSFWMMQGNDFNRRGGGNPFGRPLFYRLDSHTLKRTSIDLIQMGVGDLSYRVSVLAYSGDRDVCVVHLTSLHRQVPKFPNLTYLFDTKANKKIADLQDFPTGTRAGFFMHPVLAFTPDGKHVVSCWPGQPFQMQLHATDSGKFERAIKLKSPAGALALSPNGQMLAAYCRDGEVLILQPDLIKQIHSLHLAKPRDLLRPYEIAFAGNDDLAVVINRAQVQLYRTKDWKKGPTLTLGENHLNCVAASPDGELVAAGFGLTEGPIGKIRVMEVRTGKIVADLE